MTDREFSQQDLEDARKLFAGPCDFMRGISTLDHLPEAALPEIAFAGRSNVGKSSLVNALTGRKTLARTSNTPGRTQQLNFFDLGGRLCLVDMPGYGYAKVSKTERAAWTKLIHGFLRGRAPLRCVFILVDSRHGLKESDLELMKMLDSTAVSYRIILTKADKSTPEEIEKISAVILEQLKKQAAAYPGVHATSSESGAGIAELRAILADFNPARA
ncbi:MAG: YihA family ribosome biogenesis GTP-binding protein [Alphaproteobacteria bacterium]|nr:YihA family ribosome biogenesis GTP-binding protein [Alphaproteobacteria bacterium]